MLGIKNKPLNTNFFYIIRMVRSHDNIGSPPLKRDKRSILRNYWKIIYPIEKTCEEQEYSGKIFTRFE